jgi:hypothetical protein
MGASVLSKLEKCPFCGRAMLGHSNSLLASVVINHKDPRRLHEFFEAMKSHRWAEMLAFQEWEGGQDDLELYGLRCQYDRVNLVIVRSPVELYDNDEIIGIEALSEEVSQDLLAHVTEKEWTPVESVSLG